MHCYTLQEHQTVATIPTNVTVSKDSDFGFIMEVSWKFIISKYLREIRNYVSKLILKKNIIKQGDPNYIGTFP